MEDPTETVADRIVKELLLPQRNTSKSEININAGGAGVVVVVCVALVMFAINVMQSRDINRLNGAYDKLEGKYERMQDYLNAIYMQAPHLKPPPEKTQ